MLTLEAWAELGMAGLSRLLDIDLSHPCGGRFGRSGSFVNGRCTAMRCSRDGYYLSVGLQATLAAYISCAASSRPLSIYGFTTRSHSA